MPPPRVHLSGRVGADLAAWLDQVCEETGQGRSVALRVALSVARDNEARVRERLRRQV